MSEDAAQHMRAFIEAIGLDPEEDPELEETPQRFTEFLETFFEGVDAEPPEMTTFPSTYAGSANRTEPVVLTALPFYSMCIHHFVPFFGTVDLAYLPGESMTGFGSVGRVIDHFAGRPQVQERLVQQIATHVWDSLSPKGVLVRCRARQMCMEMRGAEKTGYLVATASRGTLTGGDQRADLLETFRAEQPKG